MEEVGAVPEVEVTPAAAPAAPAPTGAAPAPAAEPQEQEPVLAPEVRAPSSTTPLELAVPSWVPPNEQTEARMEMVNGFSAIAAVSGIPAGEAQQMLDAVVDVATAIPYRGPDMQYGTADDAVQEMISTYGEQTARALVTKAQRQSAKLGPAFQNWLDTSGVGNDVGVLTVLALQNEGLFRYTPTQAQRVIDSMMQDRAGDYYSSNPKDRLLAVAVVQILSRIAYRGEMSQEDELNHAARNPQRPTPEPRVQTGAGKSATAREEASRMLADKKGPLNNPKDPGHDAAVARWHKLLAQLG